MLTDQPRRQRSASPTSRRASAIRPHVPSAAADAHDRADRRPAAHHHPLSSDLRLWRADMQRAFGSNHIRYTGGETIRLTTDAPLAYIEREAPFVLTRPHHLVFGADEAFQANSRPPAASSSTARATIGRNGCARLDAILRLAGRDDPRRDHAEALHFRGDRRDHRRAHHLDPRSARLGAHLGLPLLLAARRLFRREGAQPDRRDADHGKLHLLHRRHRGDRRASDAAGLQHRADRSAGRAIAPHLTGYRGDGPVRIGNAAAEQTSTTPTAASSWPRRRCSSTAVCRAWATRPVPRCWSRRRQGGELAFEPDAGIWEYRGRQRIHTYSAAMCWAGCNRLAAIAQALGSTIAPRYWASSADEHPCGNAGEAPGTTSAGVHRGVRSDDLDASVLLLPELGAGRGRRSALRLHRRAMRRELAREERHALRERRRFRRAGDGFPDLPLLAGRCWWSLGRRQEARELFIDALR